MVLQCIVVPALFLQRTVDLGWPGERWLYTTVDWFAWVMIWLTLAVTVSSGVRYVVAAARVLRQHGDGGQL
jgi:hypothetical protein